MIDHQGERGGGKLCPEIKLPRLIENRETPLEMVNGEREEGAEKVSAYEVWATRSRGEKL